jgi:hypothetical protein
VAADFEGPLDIPTSISSYLILTSPGTAEPTENEVSEARDLAVAYELSVASSCACDYVVSLIELKHHDVSYRQSAPERSLWFSRRLPTRKRNAVLDTKEKLTATLSKLTLERSSVE